MKAKLLKFLSVLFFHIIASTGFILICRIPLGIELSPKRLVYTIFFSAAYFLLIWLNLYSKPYHHYLKKAFSFTFFNLTASAILLCLIENIHGFMTGSFSGLSMNSLICDFAMFVYYTAIHVFQYLWILHLSRLGFFSKNVMLVGSYDDRLPLKDLFQDICSTKQFQGQVMNVSGTWCYRETLYGELKPLDTSLEDFLFSMHVNELIICMGSRMSSKAIKQCVLFCSGHSIGYYLVPDVTKIPRVLSWQNTFTTLPLIDRFCPKRDSLILISVKRLADILLSSMALLGLSPVFLFVSILIWLEDGGKIIYVSRRIGIHGKTIRFYKFRSMNPHAEAQKAALMALNQRPDGPLFKLDNDPRVTRIGHILRTTSLDELPQLLNVLKGDLSLIGPRPHLPEEVATYTDRDRLRLECIPGISCLPQIRGRDTLGFREWVDLDLQYRKDWSPLFDLHILCSTIKVVLHPVMKKAARSLLRIKH